MPRYDVASYNAIYIYAINDEQHRGLLKIGKTSFSSPESIAQLTPNCPRLKQVADQRISQQTRTALVQYDLLHVELAVKTITMQDGSRQIQAFDDHDVHEVLLNSNFAATRFMESGRPSEWYNVDLDSAIKAIQCVKNGLDSLSSTNVSVVASQMPVIRLRHEQDENVCYTIDIFKRYDTMLWDCKMRYGKTVTAYELIKRQGYKKVIVITHRPAVEDGWGSDHKLMFNGTNNVFIDKANSSSVFDDVIDADNDRNLKRLVQSGTPFVYFTSIQDLRGSKRVGGKHNKNNGVFDLDWDLLIVDEAHEGTATQLGDAVISTIRKPNTKVLSLSGTPYNIMGDYEENKYTWTYVDEQRAKEKWYEEHPGERNPYEDLPKMNIFTFDLSEQIPTSYKFVTEDSAFNFREFFRTWTGDISRDFYAVPAGAKIGDFVHESDVNKFLDLISKESDNSNYPFSNDEYRDMFAHTFWVVPGVREAKALSSLLKAHDKFKNFEIVNIAGDGDEEKPYDEALALVKSSIKNFDKTITISCGKLTTGVTVREWTGIMMLSGSASTSASGYMQAIFRVQSPGSINGKQKKNCYVFDFAPDRTLKVIAEVHSVTHKGSQDDGPKQALGEFINFCPVIAVDGTMMRDYDVNEMMRQIKRISIDAAINSGFEDDTIYVSDAGMNMSDVDIDILRKLTDVVAPQKKGKKRNEVTVNDVGLTEEKRKLAEKAKRKPKRELTPEEKEALELYKKQKEEQKKLYNLLRAISIRLPLLFYGADADITEIIRLKDFVDIVDDESWKEFMPQGLRKELFLDVLKYYDEDVVVAAGLRIRKLAKAADELPPTLRAKRIVEIISKFKNPDKETVLTPWRVVNMHMGETLGGYNFYDEIYRTELEEPRMLEKETITSELFLNSAAKVLELNSKSGLYPLYLAYTFYMLNVTGKEKDLTLAETQKIWFDILKKHIFVVCKTKMARMITIRTLAGYSDSKVNTIYLTKLVDERMKDLPRLSNKITNPNTWGLGGERMKFDAVVGNPPYQEETAKIQSLTNGQARSKSIFQLFQLLADEITSGATSLIYPGARWIHRSGKGMSEFGLYQINDKNLDSLHFYPNSQEVFSEVAIADGISLVFKNKKRTGNGFTYVYHKNGEKIAIQMDNPGEDLIPLNPQDGAIISKVSSFVNSKHLGYVFDRILTQKLFAIESSFVEENPTKVIEYTDDYVMDYSTQIKLYANDKAGKAGRSKWYITDRDVITTNAKYIDEWQVVVSSANAGGQKRDSQLAIIDNHSAFGRSRVALGSFKTEEEAQNFYKFCKTYLVRFMFLMTDEALTSLGKKVPDVMNYSSSNSLIDFSANINEQLYELIGLSKSEIDYVEATIKNIDASRSIFSDGEE